jgi:phosphoenolpyruvate synthase/pyruvate phosphate dikinase
MITTFKKQLKEGFYFHGSPWEFDWYINIFFVEVAAYGNNPIQISYHMPIIGDEFLDYSQEDNILSAFGSFFDNKQQVDKLISNQEDILLKADLLIKNIKNTNKINIYDYEKTQKDLSLLMASVSVVFDKLISNEITKIIKHNEGVSEEHLIAHIVDESSHTKLHDSNKKLSKIFEKHKAALLKSNFTTNNLNNKALVELEKHSEEFGWLNTGERGGKPWTTLEFLDQMRNLVKLSNKADKAHFYFPANKNIQNIIKINLNDNIAADKQVELDFLFQKFLKSKLRNYYDENILEFITFEEIKSVLARPELITKYKNRTNNTKRIAYPMNGTVHLHYFDNEKEFTSITNLIQHKKHHQDSITGTIACRGKAKGTVKIIRNANDLNKIKMGDIMVAIKTQPQYVLAMNRAAAIVTDMGGITSHAAIVSREFGIPCIVGTLNATKILKDGDRVLIDAEKGLVKKIRKVPIPK